MIEATEPDSWRDLQDRVALILRECGVDAEVERPIETARGKVTIDVWAHDSSATPPQTYLVECKRWRARVPQTAVHAFRSVVGDSGANWGALIAVAGFQRGARVAAQYSNVRLLTWVEFQDLFANRWVKRYFFAAVADMSDALIEYTEPINSRVFRKANALSEKRRRQFGELRDKHLPLAALCLMFHGHNLGVLPSIPDETATMLSLPLRPTFGLGSRLSDAILDASAYRELLTVISNESRNAIAEFDDIFGHRA